jgi:hypothetical protein
LVGISDLVAARGHGAKSFKLGLRDNRLAIHAQVVTHMTPAFVPLVSPLYKTTWTCGSQASVCPLPGTLPQATLSRQHLPRHFAMQPQLSRVRASLTEEEFDARVSRDEMRVCLVGMSNCGKSHWSSQLHDGCSYSLVCVDGEIEKAIEPELRSLGFSGIDGMAEWMGFPTDDRFSANQAVYLSYEEEITAAAVARGAKTGNYVLDTTGSVIYLSRETLRQLRASFLVIHLEASDDMLGMMTDNYFLTPKPVVWGDSFNRSDGESEGAALRRCYPGLLHERRARYAELAHVTIPGNVALSRDLSLPQFLDLVREQLGVSSAQAAGP